MIKVRDEVVVTNRSLDIFGCRGKVLFINKSMNNSYVIINKVRFLVDLKDLTPTEVA